MLGDETAEMAVRRGIKSRADRSPKPSIRWKSFAGESPARFAFEETELAICR